MKYPALHFAAYVAAFAFCIFGFLSTCSPNNGYGQTVEICPKITSPNKICRPPPQPMITYGPVDGPVITMTGTTTANVIEDRSWRVEAVDSRFAIVTIGNLENSECFRIAHLLHDAKLCTSADPAVCDSYKTVVCTK